MTPRATATDVAHTDVIKKDGYDVFAFGGALSALPDLGALHAKGAETNDCWPSLLGDVHAALYKASPTVREDSAAPEAHKRLVRQTMESMDYDAMRATTRLSRAGSAIATLELGESLLAELPAGTCKKDPSDPTDKGWEYLRGCDSEADQGRAVRTMVRKAKRRAAETLETARAMGFGSGDGSDGEVDLAEAAKLARRLRASDKLRRIAELAGRMRRLASGKRKTRLKRQPEEVVGVECGNDLQRVLASELADLTGPMQPLFFLRYVQRQLLQIEMEGNEALGQGPIVVCIDESGSMEGEREVWAKAVALGLLSIAQREGREFAIVSFSNSRQCKVWEFGKGAAMGKVLTALDHFFGGGTNFATPLSAAMALIEGSDCDDPMGRADVVMITDGDCSLSDSFAAEYKARAEASRASLYTIYVQTRGRSLDAISDGVAFVANLDQDGEALELAFGF